MNGQKRAATRGVGLRRGFPPACGEEAGAGAAAAGAARGLRPQPAASAAPSQAARRRRPADRFMPRHAVGALDAGRDAVAVAVAATAAPAVDYSAR